METEAEPGSDEEWVGDDQEKNRMATALDKIVFGKKTTKTFKSFLKDLPPGLFLMITLFICLFLFFFLLFFF